MRIETFQQFLARFIVGVVLMFAGLSKIQALTGSTQVTIPFVAEIVGGGGAAVSVVLIALELSIAALIFSPKFWVRGLWLSVLLGCFFGVFVLVIDIAGEDVSSCGCLGAIQMDFVGHLALLGGMVASALLGLRSAERLEIGR